jgi:FtsP/CotA-like multicopper oxidase with cupredoxin domain
MNQARLTFSVIVLIAATTSLAAQILPPGPCAFVDIDVQKYGNQPFRNPPDIRAPGGHLTTTLAVSYTNPATTSLGGCPLTLRSYNGQLVGPTLRVPAGGVLDVLLDNLLPVETPDMVAEQLDQEASNAHIETRPHSYNTTNLHTHGLHVSPTGNSDNVLLAIPPQSSFPYEVRLPSNHPAGSFWYHAHTHGSTAIQVGSSMAGALIVDDDPATIPRSLLEANRGEKVMVFQTILYDTHGRVDDITAFFPDGSTSPQDCAAGKSSCTWQSSKRRTTINGQIVPVITMRPGEVQRWRLIDAAFRETINLRLEGHALHEIALDGIYLGRVDTWSPRQVVQLQPGYRSDVLVKASATPGTYQLLDAGSAGVGSLSLLAAPAGGQAAAGFDSGALAAEAAASFVPEVGLRGVVEDQNVLALVKVEGPPLDMPLPTSAEMAPLNPFAGVDLRKTADGVQEVNFKLGSDLDPNDGRNYFQVNYAAFNPAHVRYLRLGATEMWALRTIGDPPGVPAAQAIPPVPHVFHIHVNPFELVRKDPLGADELVWKDTILVPPPPRKSPPGTPAPTINIYTQYLDYIGQFVLHCHILDHEDLGMMEVVEVVGEQGPQDLPSHGGGH